MTPSPVSPSPWRRRWLLATAVALFAVPLPALELAPVLQEGMVLQARRPVAIWGTRADPRREVVVRLGDEEVGRTAAREDGSWLVEIGPLAYRPGHAATTLTVVNGRDTEVLREVRVGEVWLCVGQSNMRFRLGRQAEPRGPSAPMLYPQALASATDPRLSLLNVSGGTPTDRRWASCTPATVEEFSAVGYHFGQALAEALDVPIGLVDLGMGGLPIRGFLPAEMAAPSSPLGQALGAPDDKTDRIYTKDFRWFAPYGVAGVLWYQGESDIARTDTYAVIMGGLLERWRADLRAPELPFLVVPITPYERKLADSAPAQPSRRSAPMRQVLQELGDIFPYVWSIPSLDLGERFDIHPRRKREVGDRLARAALANVYGRTVPWAGPQIERVVADADGWVITFRPNDGGLVPTGDGVTGFEIELDDETWQPARAEIINRDQIRVWAGESDYRGGVRYGWWSWFVPTIVNGDGYPLGSFSR